MPQMSPLLWLFLYVLFSMIYLVCMINLYYNFLYFPIEKKVMIKESFIIWKW
uniref:ATP synthase F0 subunit 8 n=1 Tax=Lasioderma serricorne TaxID=295660 RepID=A0A344BNW1_9COLE|nr:ATP synthase F0 subunit 8 [Lasioderma serricorne]AUR43708.1 ATP synthase F0 subunit 8 [Lasioderma serricorne]AWY13616.1 ATP synthase F0 subunit 8 [Lasioderma serricorne]QCI56346.1 ATP synthase F0 subunit 8 [Lasioderma serricorne]QYH50917.1 ATP synthase F0 subunit 8 [Lasioderma serricorne]